MPLIAILGDSLPEGRYGVEAVLRMRALNSMAERAIRLGTTTVLLAR